MKNIIMIIIALFFVGCDIEETAINEATKQIETKLKEQGIDIQAKEMANVALQQAITEFNNQQAQMVNTTNQVGVAYLEAIRAQSILTLQEMKNSVPPPQ